MLEDSRGCEARIGWVGDFLADGFVAG